jgi:hypothetical protein
MTHTANPSAPGTSVRNGVTGPYSTHTHADAQHLARIASDIDRNGIAANGAAVARVVGWSRTASVSPVLLSVLSDVTQPEVARLRAFGMVATALVNASPTISDPQPREHDQPWARDAASVAA